MLDHGHGGTHDIGFLESVGSDGRGPHLPGDRHQRDGIHIGIQQRGDEVRCPRPGGGHHNTHAPGCQRIAFGRVAPTLFVAHQDMARRIAIVHRVIGGQNSSAGQPEDDIHTEFR